MLFGLLLAGVGLAGVGALRWLSRREARRLVCAKANDLPELVGKPVGVDTETYRTMTRLGMIRGGWWGDKR